MVCLKPFNQHPLICIAISIITINWVAAWRRYYDPKVRTEEGRVKSLYFRRERIGRGRVSSAMGGRGGRVSDLENVMAVVAIRAFMSKSCRHAMPTRTAVCVAPQSHSLIDAILHGYHP